MIERELTLQRRWEFRVAFEAASEKRFSKFRYGIQCAFAANFSFAIFRLSAKLKFIFGVFTYKVGNAHSVVEESVGFNVCYGVGETSSLKMYFLKIRVTMNCAKQETAIARVKFWKIEMPKLAIWSYVRIIAMFCSFGGNDVVEFFPHTIDIFSTLDNKWRCGLTLSATCIKFTSIRRKSSHNFVPQGLKSREE